eukprot:1130647-Rhodomonas_salina.5
MHHLWNNAGATRPGFVAVVERQIAECPTGLLLHLSVVDAVAHRLHHQLNAPDLAGSLLVLRDRAQRPQRPARVQLHVGIDIHPLHRGCDLCPHNHDLSVVLTQSLPACHKRPPVVSPCTLSSECSAMCNPRWPFKRIPALHIPRRPL